MEGKKSSQRNFISQKFLEKMFFRRHVSFSCLNSMYCSCCCFLNYFQEKILHVKLSEKVFLYGKKKTFSQQKTSSPMKRKSEKKYFFIFIFFLLISPMKGKSWEEKFRRFVFLCVKLSVKLKGRKKQKKTFS